MKFSAAFPTLGVVLAYTVNCGAAFYGDPPDAHHPWAVHDMNRPQPKVVVPGTFSTPEQPGKPPSDAIVLFDGKDLSGWVSAKDGVAPAKWKVEDGHIEVVPSTGDIQTKEQFGDCQLHVEWAAPAEVKGSSQGRGNGGIFLMGICEVQVLDVYENQTYADGYAASVYGVNPAMVNAIKPPGQYQVYDIVFRRPVWKEGKMLDPGYVTVFVNGVLAQDATPLEGPTGHMQRTTPGPFPEKGPIKLQDHGNQMQFRNIWYRPLPPRPIEGGTDGGFLTEAATTAKRKAIAADIRADAEKQKDNALPYFLRLMESLAYEKDSATVKQVEDLAAKYDATLKQLTAEQVKAKKDEIRGVHGAVRYTVRFGYLPDNLPLKTDLDRIVKEQKWDK
jgi:hypothetical protein